MPISLMTLWSDSINFIKNTVSHLAILLCVLVGIHYLMMTLIQPDINNLTGFLEQIAPMLSNGNLSLDQLKIEISRFPPDLLQALMSSAFTILFANLVKALIVIALIIAFIHTLSMGQFSLSNVTTLTMQLIIKLALSAVLLLPVGFVLFTFGSLLGIIGIFIVITLLLLAFSLLPTIFVLDKQSLFTSITQSYRVGFKYAKILFSIVVIYVLLTNLLPIWLAKLPSSTLTNLLIVIIIQFINFFMALICYRLYTIYKSTLVS